MAPRRKHPPWIYRGLLLAYPRSFRERYGDEMGELFRSRRERARRSRGAARLSFWVAILADLARTASRERLEAWQRRPKRTRRKESRMDTLFQDLKLALRRILDAPGFTATAVLIVGLGIGVNVAVFGVVESILFRPLPWERPEELVWIYQDSDDGEPASCSYPAYRDIASHENVFSRVAAMIPGRDERLLTPSGESQLVSVSYVTSSLFPVLGLEPSMGRWLDEQADHPGGEPVAVVSHRAWRTRFGSDPSIVGRGVRLSGASVTIVGVGPEGYRGESPGFETDFWVSIAAAGPVGGDYYWSTLERREDHWFLVVARLRPDVTASGAQGAMNVLAERFAVDYPSLDEGRSVTVIPAAQVRVHPEYDAFLFPTGGVLLAVAGLVLLVACANLANLLLARGSARGREIAIRLSMGATRGRLLRQLLTESTVLALAGGLVGLGLGAGGGPAPRLVPASAARSADPGSPARRDSAPLRLRAVASHRPRLRPRARAPRVSSRARPHAERRERRTSLPLPATRARPPERARCAAGGDLPRSSRRHGPPRAEPGERRDDRSRIRRGGDRRPAGGRFGSRLRRTRREDALRESGTARRGAPRRRARVLHDAAPRDAPR